MNEGQEKGKKYKGEKYRGVSLLNREECQNLKYIMTPSFSLDNTP